MKKAKENKKYITSRGITLIPLIITVVLMMILVGVVITNGLHSVDNVKLQSFFKELQIIQKRVDVIYQEAKAGNNSFIAYNEETQSFISSIGTDVAAEVEIPEVDDNTGYYLYTPTNLEQLEIEGISQSVYINWAARDVVSVNGFTSKGTTYYRDPSNIKPEYNGKQDISLSQENIKITGTSVKKVQIVNLKTIDNEDINNFEAKYRLKDETTWKETTGNNSFQTAIPGTYEIQISRKPNSNGYNRDYIRTRI